MKYIDAERLQAEIERLRSEAEYKRYEAFGNHDGFIINEAKEYICMLLKSFIDSLQQEQPEVDLEKFTDKIKTFQGRYKHPEIVSIKGAMAFMARMFYQYPNVARLWYENLPKATQD